MFALQTGSAGGGSGGNIYLESDSQLTVTGNVYCNGGSASGTGGGGAGGRVHAFYLTGTFHSGKVQAEGE